MGFCIFIWIKNTNYFLPVSEWKKGPIIKWPCIFLFLVFIDLKVINTEAQIHGLTDYVVCAVGAYYGLLPCYY